MKSMNPTGSPFLLNLKCFHLPIWREEVPKECCSYESHGNDYKSKQLPNGPQREYKAEIHGDGSNSGSVAKLGIFVGVILCTLRVNSRKNLSQVNSNSNHDSHACKCKVKYRSKRHKLEIMELQKRSKTNLMIRVSVVITSQTKQYFQMNTAPANQINECTREDNLDAIASFLEANTPSADSICSFNLCLNSSWAVVPASTLVDASLALVLVRTRIVFMIAKDLKLKPTKPHHRNFDQPPHTSMKTIMNLLN
jgi:hypothetical protein